MDRKNITDKMLIVMAECYVILPIIIFLWGWTRWIYALVGTVVFVALGISLFKSCASTKTELILSKKKWSYWIYVVALLVVWVYLSGIGGFSYQNGDFWARNPIYRDLSTYSWPVVYDFAPQSYLVQDICGSETAAFSYYFCWWLPPGLIANLFGVGEMARNIILMIWTISGLFLTVYLLCRKMNRCIWYIPVILILFSGLDSIPYWIQNNFFETFPWVTHIEYWSWYFQYSSNTTQIFWVFNQSVPVWLIMALMLQQKDSKCLISLASISFAYSPWATFGMVPYAIYGSLRGKERIKASANVINYGVALFMICIFGVFYMAGAGDTGTYGFIFSLNKGTEMRILCVYLEFAFFEFLIYFLIIGKRHVRDEYYWLTLMELLIIPLFVVRDNNFVMRSSIPALFMLMYYLVLFLGDKKDDDKSDKVYRVRKVLFVLVFCIGVMTPIAEINRSIINTYTSDDILEDPVGSFGDMQTTEEWRIEVIREQFFAYDYEKMPFFKYR